MSLSSVHTLEYSYYNAQQELCEELLDREIPPGALPGITPPGSPHQEKRESASSETHTYRSTSALIERTASSHSMPESATENIAKAASIEEKGESPPESSNTVAPSPRALESTMEHMGKTSSIEEKSENSAESSSTVASIIVEAEKGYLEAQNSHVENEWKRPISDKRWYLTCFGMVLGAILYGLDTTIAADVQGPILQSLGDIEKLAWVGIGFPMGAVSVILLVGCFYSLFEIKWLIIGFLIIFSVGSAVCGAAPTMDALVIGRVIAGIGGAGTYLGALTYVSKFTSPKEQPIYNGLIGLCWGGGTILGPIVGGGFSETSATWRWAFYINLPLTAIVVPLAFLVFPKYNPKPEITTWTKLKSIDWIGAILTATIFSLFQIILTFAGSMYAWDSPLIITLWAIFGVVLITYIFQQTFCIFTTLERRMFPIHFLKSRTMILVFIGTAASITGLAISIYYIPLFFQFTRGDSAIQAAIRLLPLICIYVFSLILSSVGLPIWGRYSPLYICSGILLVVGGALMHTIKVDTAKATIYGYEVLIALGAGSITQTGYSVGVTKVDQKDVPNALGFMNVAQIGSAAVSLSIADCIYQNIGFIGIRNALVGYGFTDDLLRGALAGSQSSVLSAGDPAVIELVLEAITATIDKIWFMVVAAGAVCFVCGVFMKHEKLKLEVVAAG